MDLYSYFYYRVYSLYKNQWKDNDPKLYGVALVSLMQSFNLGTILFPLTYLYFGMVIDTTSIFLFVGILALINFIIYGKFKKYEILAKKWDSETTSKRFYKGVSIIIYMILSSILFFSVAIIVGKMN